MSIKTKLIINIIALFVIFSNKTNAQSYWINENNQYTNTVQAVYQPGTNLHTSVKPFQLRETSSLFNKDSLDFLGIPNPHKKRTFIGRAFVGNILHWENEDVTISINPLFNFELGKEQADGTSTFINTRGVMLNGKMGKNFAFYSDFYENQGNFPNYIYNFSSEMEVIPGQGRTKTYNYDPNSTEFDYSSASGYISVNGGEHFNFQLGNGKNFIGDGYRSLLLSDAASNYTYLKANATYGKVKYMVLWTSLTNFQGGSFNDSRYPIKYGTFHYLDWNIGKRISLGFFQSTLWSELDTAGNRNSIPWEYANPIFSFKTAKNNDALRSISVIGLNAKYVISSWLTLYGQTVVNELTKESFFSSSSSWKNRQGYQVGIKTFDLLGIKNLRLQGEYNKARPFLYTHRDAGNSYSHMNQSLAHPLGANFKETIGILYYRYKRLHLKAQVNYAEKGMGNDSTAMGDDLFISNELRQSDINNTFLQGDVNKITNADLSLSYLFNPINNFNICLGYHYRKQQNTETNLLTKFIYVGIRTSLRNIYYDF